MTALEIFRAVAPEFASVSDSDVNTLLTLAAARLNPTVWGDLYTQATAYLAAHVRALAERTGGAAGPVTSRRAGEVSESYGFSGGSSYYAATSYGQQFDELRKSLPGGAPFVTRFRTVEDLYGI